MRFLRLSCAPTALLCCAALVGCNFRNGEKVEYTVPGDVVALKAGESKEVALRRKGKDLKEQTLTVTSPDPKVKVEPASPKFAGKDEEAKLTVRAEADAAEKEYTINVKAGDVAKTFRVRVEKAAAANGAGNKKGGADAGAAAKGGTPPAAKGPDAPPPAGTKDGKKKDE